MQALQAARGAFACWVRVFDAARAPFSGKTLAHVASRCAPLRPTSARSRPQLEVVEPRLRDWRHTGSAWWEARSCCGACVRAPCATARRTSRRERCKKTSMRPLNLPRDDVNGPWAECGDGPSFEFGMNLNDRLVQIACTPWPAQATRCGGLLEEHARRKRSVARTTRLLARARSPASISSPQVLDYRARCVLAARDACSLVRNVAVFAWGCLHRDRRRARIAYCSTCTPSSLAPVPTPAMRAASGSGLCHSCARCVCARLEHLSPSMPH